MLNSNSIDFLVSYKGKFEHSTKIKDANSSGCSLSVVFNSDWLSHRSSPFETKQVYVENIIER